jgi:phosphate transport system permease protein
VAEQTLEVSTKTPSSTRTVKRGYLGDRVAQYIFLICAVLIVIIIFGIFIFLGINGFATFRDPHANIFTFFTSTNWDPQGQNGTPSFGILGFIIGSVVTTLLSVIIATPFAFGMALFMTETTPRWLNAVLRPLLEIFSGMPSVVIGFLALIVLVPFLTRITQSISPSPVSGLGWGAATLVLVVMILPTITSISIDVIRAVPPSVREASLALGSTRWQMMKSAILPAAAPGLATAVVFGMGRAIGEALAVQMVLGGDTSIPSPFFTKGLFFQPNVNMTLAIVAHFNNSFDTERSAYFMIGFVLLVISFLFVCVSRYLGSRSVYQ